MIVAAAELSASNLYLKGIATDPDSANVFAVPTYKEIIDQDLSGQVLSAMYDGMYSIRPVTL